MYHWRVLLSSLCFLLCSGCSPCLTVSLCAELPREIAPLLERCVEDARRSHELALKRAVFDYVQHDSAEQQRLAHLRLPPPPATPPAPDHGLVATPQHDILQPLNMLSQSIAAGEAKTHARLVDVVGNGADVLPAHNLFDARLPGKRWPMAIEEFSRAQAEHLSERLGSLLNECVPVAF